jgi:hypothetical protein
MGSNQQGTFENILREEIETLLAEVLRIYKLYAVVPFEQPCFRDGEYPNERDRRR